MKRDDFERWFGGSKYTQVVYPSAATKQIALDGWQACSAHYEAERNSLLAVIEKQREALQEAIKHHRTTSLHLAIENYGSEDLAKEAGRKVWKELVPKALALTPENVRLVEVGAVEYSYEQDGSPTGQYGNLTQSWFIKEGTKLYTIEAKGE